MKSFLRLVLKFLTLFLGIVTTGILMVPAGALVMLISFIWRITDKLVSRLDAKQGSR